MVSPDPGWGEPIRTAVATVIAIGIALMALLLSGTMETHALITPGGLGPSADVIAMDFGDDVLDPDATGYDGQQTYAIARYFPDLHAAANQLDNARYRLLRILTPALASPLPPGPATVYGLAVVNLFGIGLAVAGAARILQRGGASPQLGALAAAPLLFELAATTTGPLAWGLTMVALDLLLRGNHRLAVALFALAVLSRETTAVAVALAAAGLLLRDRQRALRITPWYFIPVLVIGAWHVALGAIVGGELPRRASSFAFIELRGAELSIAALVFLLGAWGAWAWRHAPSLSLSSLGFTLWMAYYTIDILDPLALVRVNALPIILGLMGIALAITRTSDSTPRPRAECSTADASPY